MPELFRWNLALAAIRSLAIRRRRSGGDGCRGADPWVDTPSISPHGHPFAEVIDTRKFPRFAIRIEVYRGFCKYAGQNLEGLSVEVDLFSRWQAYDIALTGNGDGRKIVSWEEQHDAVHDFA